MNIDAVALDPLPSGSGNTNNNGMAPHCASLARSAATRWSDIDFSANEQFLQDLEQAFGDRYRTCLVSSATSDEAAIALKLYETTRPRFEPSLPPLRRSPLPWVA